MDNQQSNESIDEIHQINNNSKSSHSTNHLKKIDKSETYQESINQNSIRLYLTIIFSCFGGFLFGYDTGIIAGALILMKSQFNLTVLEQSFIVSVTIIGAWIFSLLNGYLSDKLGRKMIILISNFIFTIGSLVMAFSNSAFLLIVGRFILGAAIGSSSSTIPIYLAEISQHKQRGNLILIYNLMLTGGQFISGIVAGVYSTTTDGWRYMVGLASIISVMASIYFFFWGTESPRFLLKIGLEKDAFKELKSLRKNDRLTKIEFDEIKLNLNNSSVNDSKYSAGIIHIFKIAKKNVSLRKALVLGCMLQLIQQLAGINTIMYYSATIIEMAGVNNKSKAIWLGPAITGLVNWMFTFVGLYFVERLGRRKLILVSIVGVCLSLLFLSGSFYISKSTAPIVTMNLDSNSTCSLMSNCNSCLSNSDCGFCIISNKFDNYQSICLLKSDDLDYSKDGFCSKNQTSTQKFNFITNSCPSDYAYLIILGIVFYLIFFASGLGCMPWVINSEIFPLNYRSACFSLTTSMNWVSNTFVSLTFLSFIQLFSETGTFLIYFFFSSIGLFYFYFSLPETKDKKLEEIEKMFDSKSSIH